MGCVCVMIALQLRVPLSWSAYVGGAGSAGPPSLLLWVTSLLAAVSFVAN